LAIGLIVLLMGLGLPTLHGPRADVLVLLHGYQSGAGTWFGNGVVNGLAAHGWGYGGELLSTPEGPMLRGTPQGESLDRVYYVVNLPYEAPLDIQARTLEPLLGALVKRHAGERLVLVGHSNGGVVARLCMVRNPELGIYGLITIASPHLGTDRADLALLVGSTPLSMMAPFLGAGTFNRSRHLYRDIAEETPGNLLYWLNRQPHPRAHYVGIVRSESFFSLGDLVVPAESQDLRNVPALRDRARRVSIEAGHALEEADGRLLGRLIDEMLATEPSPQQPTGADARPYDGDS
jgi:triacylglycerol lipase